jgi:hypothetical protein
MENKNANMDQLQSIAEEVKSNGGSQQLADFAESANKSYTFLKPRFEEDVPILPANVAYGEMKLKNFYFREVYINEQLTGEFHIGLFNRTRDFIEMAMLFFSRHLSGDCEIGMIDTANDLNLEYQIYIKTTNQLLIPAMMATMDGLDVAFGEIMK